MNTHTYYVVVKEWVQGHNTNPHDLVLITRWVRSDARVRDSLRAWLTEPGIAEERKAAIVAMLLGVE